MAGSLPKLIKDFVRRGPRQATLNLWRTCDVKSGTLIGKDAFGNMYYENKLDEIIGRDRWVEGASGDFDASQVPAAWHKWLHKMTDKVPRADEQSLRVWMVPHSENKTGTPAAYRPYNTTTPKTEYWKPNQ
jgi:NADH:ubiquinone oxidoreductase subunit